jgi:quinol monooxygenase YgiN
MRFLQLLVTLAVLAFATVRPVHAEETMSGPVYTVVYFEVAPSAAPDTAAAARRYAEASGKEDGNTAFEMFQEIARPNRFAVVEVWRDKKAGDAHGTAAAAKALGQKLQPSLVGGFGLRVESECGAVAVGRTYLLPPLSSGGASLV